MENNTHEYEVPYMVWINFGELDNPGEDDEIKALKAQNRKDAIQEVKKLLKGLKKENIHRAYLFKAVSQGDKEPEENIYELRASINPTTGKVFNFSGYIYMSTEEDLDAYDLNRMYGIEIPDWQSSTDEFEIYYPQGDYTWTIYLFPEGDDDWEDNYDVDELTDGYEDYKNYSGDSYELYLYKYGPRSNSKNRYR